MAVQIGSARVNLDTWEDIQFAAAQGLINERTHCELKKGLPPPAHNVEVARDLASLTVEGGLLVYGVADAGGGVAGEVAGIENAESARTRLVGLAQGAVQPSIVCDVLLVPHPKDPGKACLLVVVPPSAVAPHRADERYWGRSSEGKRVLSDAEVAALFARRRNRDDDFLEDLVRVEELDPVPPSRRLEGHLYFSAEPLQGNGQPSPWSGDEHPLNIVRSANMPSSTWGGASLTSINHSETHPRGLAASSNYPMDRDDCEKWSVRLLLEDHGGVRWASGLGTVTRSLNGEHVRMIMAAPVLAQVDQCVRLVSHVADLRGEAGSWRLGVRLTQLKGIAAVNDYGDWSLGYPRPYPEEEFVQVIDASAAELREAPTQVVQRLMYPMARGLGLQDRFFPYDHPRSFFNR